MQADELQKEIRLAEQELRHLFPDNNPLTTDLVGGFLRATAPQSYVDYLKRWIRQKKGIKEPASHDGDASKPSWGILPKNRKDDHTL